MERIFGSGGTNRTGKNILFLLLFILIVVVCTGCDDGKVTSVETLKNSSGGCYVVEKEYRGHRYLIFQGKGDLRISGVVHDPDCPCLPRGVHVSGRKENNDQ